MSTEERRLSRRQLLQLGLAGAASLPLSVFAATLAGAQQEVGVGRSVSRTTGGLRETTPTICHGCSARCGMLGFSEGGVLVKLEGNPADPNSRGALCARGSAAINYYSSPERLTQPLRKNGPRRGGKWVQVSWDEALGELAERLRHRSRPDALVVELGTLAQRGLVARFAAACGTPNLQVDEFLYRGNSLAAGRLVAGSALGEADIAGSKYILNFGGSPYEHHPAFFPFVRRLVDARANGARLITFDPRLSLTAGRSDRWLPLRPGSYGAVALAMAKVIVDRGLQDTGFLQQWTDLTPQTVAEMLAPYDVGTIASQAGLDADELQQIASEFATTKPACALAGDGVAHRRNGVSAESAVRLLNVLTGNVGVPGGIYRPPVFPLRDLDPIPSGSLAGLWPAVEAGDGWQGDVLGAVVAGKITAEVLLIHKANPVYAYPKGGELGNLIADRDRVPFVACYDSFLTETAELADLVLPAATYLEAWDLDSVPALGRVPFVQIGQPLARLEPSVVDAPELYTELAKRMDGATATFFPFSTGEEYVTKLASQLPGLQGNRGFEELRSRGFWSSLDGEVPYRYYEGPVSGGARPFALSPARMAQKGVRFSDLDTEAPLGNGELYLVPYQSSLHYRSETGASKWLNEIEHDNPLWVNTDVARARGWRDGDAVRVVSSTGSMETRIRLTHGIRPDTVALAYGVGHWAMSRTARAVRFSSEDPDTNLLWWGTRGNGTAPNRVLADGDDPAGLGLAWQGTRVTVAAL
ncbi:MAG: molybdopterin-containing oxidoreductase family protein [Chloroflexota bacterium]